MTPAEKRQILKEISWVFAATLIVTGGLALLQLGVGWIRGYVLAIAAMVFMYLPLEVLHRQGLDPADFGIHRRDLWQALRHAALICVIVFPAYSVCFHVWQTEWIGHQLKPAEARLDQWPLDLQDPPKIRALQEGEVRTYTYGDELRLRWRLPPGQAFEATVESDLEITPTIGRPASYEDGKRITYRGGSHGHIGFVAYGSEIRLSVKAGGDSLPAERLRIGTTLSKAEEMPYRAERSYWWIINLILVQFLLVALPEELFYRGYLQSRLDQYFTGSDRTIFGVSVNVKSILLTSALFAIGHIITIPSPARLAVFFPSLVFGWMRRATGGIIAPLIFHALCNLFVEFAMLLYG